MSDEKSMHVGCLNLDDMLSYYQPGNSSRIEWKGAYIIIPTNYLEQISILEPPWIKTQIIEFFISFYCISIIE